MAARSLKVAIDGTVRCPWHHACFDLRTGQALRAPALNPVACYRVERHDETLVVTKKEGHDPLAPVFPSQAGASPGRVVIVGGGAAADAAAEMLRREGYAGA